MLHAIFSTLPLSVHRLNNQQYDTSHIHDMSKAAVRAWKPQEVSTPFAVELSAVEPYLRKFDVRQHSSTFVKDVEHIRHTPHLGLNKFGIEGWRSRVAASRISSRINSAASRISSRIEPLRSSSVYRNLQHSNTRCR